MTEVIEIKTANASTDPGVLKETQSTYQNPDDVLRVYLAAITGLDKRLVRKRWLPKPGTQPKIGVNWAAVGVERIETQGFPYQKGNKALDDLPNDDIERTSWQTLHCLATFYGPEAAELADTFREGIQLTQNDAQLRKYGLTIQSVANEATHLPDLLFEQWIDRYDVSFKLGRSVTRNYGVRTITAGQVEIFSEKGKV